MQLSIDALMRPQTQTEKILELLQKNPGGVTSRELNEIAFRYSARIAELRKQGYNIKSTQIKKGLWNFKLERKENEGI